jgi:protein involved in polysaccharide export with SLBB domain
LFAIPRYTVRAVWIMLLLLLPLSSRAQGQNGTDASARAASARVRAGDRVALNFLRDRELSGEVTVNERGEAPFPKIGLLRVTDMTIAQLQDTLRARYAEYLRTPEIEIAVLRRVVVNGEVKVPNVYMVDGSSTVRDVIARAGGLTEAGARTKVAIVRDGERIPLRGWERDIGEASDLQSGDQVIVGRKSWFTMNALSVISTAVLVTSFVISVAK